MLSVFIIRCGDDGGSSSSDGGGGEEETIDLTTFQNASVVIGQVDFTARIGDTNASTFTYPKGNIGVSSTGALYISDTGHNRIMVYNSTSSSNGASADLVLGQTNFTSNSANGGGAVSASGFDIPQSVFVSGTQLFAVDNNNRVLIWNTLPTTTNKAADVAVGQANLTSKVQAATQNGLKNPAGLCVAGIKLIKADSANHRVLVWTTFPSSHGQNVDIVIGQADMTSNSSGTTNTTFY